MAPAKPLVEKKPRYFSVEQANKTLPLVRVIVEDIVRQSRLVNTLQQRLTRVLRERRRPSEDLYSEEMKQSQSELEIEEEKLQGYVDELTRLGVELKSDEIGLCDFRSLRDGREVYLCWKLGEAEVQFWHELDAGVAGRRRLRPAESDAGVPARDDGF
jgi:hypothetical protein